MDRVILIDKPKGWTSFDVVAKIRGIIRAEFQAKGVKPTKKQLRVGHAGTLDPFATGLLIILIGDECKKAGDYLKLDKTYEFTAKLGQVSTTGDPEGQITEYNLLNTTGDKQLIPTLTQIEDVLANFTGEITQIPPAFSAIKVGGKRAYKLAREGKSVEIPARQVKINRLEVLEYDFPYLKCVCDVSSGTYIRTLTEDIGEALGIGAYCSALRRTVVGEFNIKDGIEVKALVT